VVASALRRPWEFYSIWGMEPHDANYRRPLSQDWLIRASAEVDAEAQSISQPGFDTSGWTGARVPSTVLAALVEQGRYPDPYPGMNLKAIPREPFLTAWWYRTQFTLARAETHKTVLLEFDGINYAGDIWLNGRQVATAEAARGAFRRFQYDVSAFVTPGLNVLAVRVVPPQPGDYTVGFVDWNPPAPDRDMGLFRPVRADRVEPRDADRGPADDPGRPSQP
jgi:exo-1,4-beta-D-glucosaminidase